MKDDTTEEAVQDENEMPTSTDSKREIIAVDLFCGAGGFSEGLRKACEELGYDLKVAAVNHWQTAIDTHEANHEHAEQYHSKIEQLYPPNVIEDLTGDKRTTVDLLTAGPECTHFSNARGGVPVSEQKRSSAWYVLDWIEKLEVETFILENVGEIESWGPVENGKPSRDGTIFNAWINVLNKLGYAVEWTKLNAADYGDPTSRNRFILIGKRSGSVTFPTPTHSDEDTELPNHRTAAEIIDWSDPGSSIWTRDLEHSRIHNPPKQSTMERIAEGLRRHCSEQLKPYADVLETLGRDEIRYLRQNRVVDAADAELLAETIDEPFLVRTQTAESGETDDGTILLRQQDGAHPIDVDERAVPTIATSGAHAITTFSKSLIMPKNGLYRGLHSNRLYDPTEQPHHTVTTDPRSKLVSPSLVRYSHGGATLSTNDPMPTIATERGGVFALSNPYLCPLYSSRETQDPRTRSVDRPLMTVPKSKSPAGLSTPVVQPFIDDYEGPAKPLNQPLNTIETRDRFALCIPEMWPYGLDVKYRMLQPHELKQAQGFDLDYTLTGTKTDKTEQIGNAVPVNMAKALCRHVLTSEKPNLGSYGAGLSADPDAEVPSYEEIIGDD